MSDLDILQSAQGSDNSKKVRRALIIFSRAPVAGEVKTRLIGARCGTRVLNARDTCRLYGAMLKDTFTTAHKLENCQLAVAHTPDIVPESEYSLRDSLPTLTTLEFYPQGAGDLGARLTRCFAYWRNRGFEHIVIIGSDAPDLPPEYLQAAFEQLENHDLVFGPARDGGFYCVGAAQPINGKLFSDVEWSTARVLESVLENTIREQQSTARLEPWRDVDDEEDLNALISRLKKNRPAALSTRAVLTAWGAL